MADLATITGKVLKPTGAVLANAYIKFVLKNVGTDDTVSPSEVYPRGYFVEGLTNASGVLKASDGTSDLQLWVNANSGVESVYEIIFPDRREALEVIVPASASGGSIDLEELIENHQVEGSTNQQSNVLDAAKQYTNVLAADPSNNSSFVAAPWRVDLSIDNVDNTSDANKPVSTATQSALDLKASIANVNSYFADPDDNASFDKSRWLARLDLPDAIVVDGAGIGEVNGAYLRDGSDDGKPRYTLLGGTTDDDSIRWINALNQWVIFSAGNPKYNSSDDTDTPDLVITWVAQAIPATPLPIVSRATWPEYLDAIERDNAVVIASTSTTLTANANRQVSQTASGITTTLWASPISGDKATIHNYSGGANTIAGNGNNIKSGSATTDTSVTINNNEVLKFIYDGTNWLLTT